MAGALLKDDYLAVVSEAGFADVRILDETVFPIANIFNDPTAKMAIDKLNLTEEKVMDAASSVVSIKVQTIKPE